MCMSAEAPDSDFKHWIDAEFAERGAFTALVALVEIGERSIKPRAFISLDVTAAETDWPDLVAAFNSAGMSWNGASFFPASVDGGPLEDAAARIALRAMEQRVRAELLALNDGFFFDRDGQRILVEKADPQ